MERMKLSLSRGLTFTDLHNRSLIFIAQPPAKHTPLRCTTVFQQPFLPADCFCMCRAGPVTMLRDFEKFWGSTRYSFWKRPCHLSRVMPGPRHIPAVPWSPTTCWPCCGQWAPVHSRDASESLPGNGKRSRRRCASPGALRRQTFPGAKETSKSPFKRTWHQRLLKCDLGKPRKRIISLHVATVTILNRS